jgi:hypothetical protein
LNTQTQPIHWAAFLLDPISSLQYIDADGQEAAIQWLLDYVSKQEKKKVSCSIQDFLGKENGFTQSHISQLYVDNLARYWTCYLRSKIHDELAQLAVRIYKTVANSVASERAFSVMGLVVTKLRNRLGSNKANMLIFIYMNLRVLERGNDLLLGDWVDKTDQDQVEIEDLLVLLDQELQDDQVELDDELESSE